MKIALPPPPYSRWALGMSAAAQRTVFVALMLTLLSLASQQSVLAQDYTWTERTAPVAQAQRWEGVTYGNGLFVAIAQWNEGSDVMTSPDGITWTARSTPWQNDWVSVTYGNGLFVAVASSGYGYDVMTSPNGITWALGTTPPNSEWTSVTYGNGLFVAVSSNGEGNDVMTSTDGINWTLRTTPTYGEWSSVTYGNGLFVAVALDSEDKQVMTSPDGIVWTGQTAAAYKSWTSVTYGNGLFVAVAADFESDDLMTSPDGITWTSRTINAETRWISVTYGNGLFVAIARYGDSNGNDVLTSPDGITWTLRSSIEVNDWKSVTFGNGLFVAVANSSGSGNLKTMSWQAQMAVNAGNNQTATAGAPVATAPSVIVRNPLNNPVSGVSVTFAVASGGGSITGGTATTNASGIATVGSWTLGPTAGSNTLTATSTGVTGSPLTLTATGTAGAATQIAINAGNNQTAAVGAAVAIAPSVIVRDASNNPVAGVTVTFAVGTGGGSVSGGTVTTNASGIATVGGWTLGPSAGSNTLTATSAGLTGSPLTFTATGTPAVTADPPTVGSQPGGETGPGDTVTLRQILTNPSSAPTTMTYEASLPAGLAGVGCSVPFGSCVIGAGAKIAPSGEGIYRKQSVFSSTSTSTVTWTGTVPGNGSVTIIYVVQISALGTSGTQYQINSTINGLLGPSVTITIKGAPAGPGDPIGAVVGPVSAQKPGSVLIYNLYSSGLNPRTNDSRITITNTSPSRRAYVHFFFIDGSNCSVADMTITLTANQTTSFLASDFDPGVTGYLIAVATDANGCPVIQNDLIGESLVKLESGHRAALPALGVAALGLGGVTCNPNETTTTLAFDGSSYNALPRALAVSGLSSIANGYSSLLVVNRVGGDLGTGAARLGSLFGLLYDDQEVSQSFTLTGNVCQLRGVLGNNFPRTAPRYTTVIPAGRSGWMRFAAAEDQAITGVLLVEAQNGFWGGHNLHHLTTTSTATLTIPVYPAE